MLSKSYFGKENIPRENWYFTKVELLEYLVAKRKYDSNDLMQKEIKLISRTIIVWRRRKTGGR